jgi:hypothetical protein
MVKVNQRNIPGINELRRYLHQSFFDRSVSYRLRIYGILLLIVSILFFINPFAVNYKIGFSLLVIAVFMIFLFPAGSNQIGMEIKILISVSGWVLLMFVITGHLNLTTFFFLVVLGIIICKELTEVILSPPLRKRFTFLILIFFSVSMILFLEKIINIFHI